MVSHEELQYLYWIGREVWDGSNTVIEFGPWLGGTTQALAAGMRANPRAAAGGRLHVVDNFMWRPFMNDRAPITLDSGESFRQFFERNMEEYLELIVVHEERLPDDEAGDIEFDTPLRDHGSDLPLFSWDSADGEVEVVFIDGAKSWRALVHIFSEVIPHASSDSFWIFQDFKNWASYWVPMCISLVRRTQPSSFALTHSLASDTVTFRRVSTELTWLETLPASIDEISIRDGMSLLDDAAILLRENRDRFGEGLVSLSGVAFLGSKDAWDEAIALFRTLEAKWPASASRFDLERTRSWLQSRCEANLEPSIRLRSVARYQQARHLASRVKQRLST